MGLSDEQLKFLEDFILHRHLGHLKSGQDVVAEQDQKGRASQRLDLLQKLSEVPPLTEGRPQEKQAAAELDENVRATLAEETPPQTALDQAENTLKKLSDHVADVQKDITFVRKPRFEKGQAALAALAGISLEFPVQCPEDDEQVLIKEHGRLAGMLAAKKDWANITDWDEEDLISINEDLDRLATDARHLREKVDQAVQVLADASAAARKAMTPTGSVGFSEAQTLQMAELFRAATEEAGKDVLRADGPIRALEKLAKHAASTARIRARVKKRISDLPDTAPVGATVAQKIEWKRLRDNALAAADEVLET